LVAFSLKSNAQYELYKCSETGVRALVNEKWTEWKTQDVDMLIRVCTDDLRVEFSNTAETVFYMDGVLKTETDIDGDGDKRVTTTWRGYDQLGRKCSLTSIDYPALPARNFWLRYYDAEVFFMCKIISTKQI